MGASAESGRFEAAAAASLKLRDQFAELAGVSGKTAEDITTSFDQIGAGGRDLAVALIPVAQAMAQAKGVDLADAFKTLLDMFSKLRTGGRSYLDTVTSLTLAQREQWQSMMDTGKAGDAALFVAQALRSQYSQTTAAAIANTAANREQRDAIVSGRIAVDDYGRAIEPLGDEEARVTAAMQSMSRAFDEAGERARALMNASDVTAAHLREDAEKIVSSVNSIATEGKKIDEQMATIKQQMAVSLGDPKAMAELQETYRLLGQQKITNAQQQADPLGLGRDSFAQAQAQLTHLQNTWRGTTEGMTEQTIAFWRKYLSEGNRSAQEQLGAQNALEAAQKQLFDEQSRAGAKAAKDVLGAQQASIEGQIRAQEELTKVAIDHSQAQVKLKAITPSQGENAEISALKKEQDAVDALYAKELALAGQTATKKREIANQEVAFNDQIQLKLQQAQEKAAEASQKAWETATNAIKSAFDGQINGLMRGTTSWSQALRNVLASLTEDMAKFFVNWGLEAAENEAKQLLSQNTVTAAHIAGSAAMAASDQTAAASGALAWAGQALKAIAADAAQTFGGVFAFMAPILGPAAAGPAAAASSAVLGAGAAIASADIGMWSVPQDQLALVHHNELIMPAAQATAFRSMLSGGGGQGSAGGVSIAPQTHLHVSAIDGASVGQWFRSNQAPMMKAINDAVLQGAHLGMRCLATIR